LTRINAEQNQERELFLTRINAEQNQERELFLTRINADKSGSRRSKSEKLFAAGQNGCRCSIRVDPRKSASDAFLPLPGSVCATARIADFHIALAPA